MDDSLPRYQEGASRVKETFVQKSLINLSTMAVG